jgi:hypothetical protein
VRERLDAAHARIAAGVRPPLSEFDLVRGLTGLGAYLLRRDPGGDLVRSALAYLVQLTHPLPAPDEAGPSAPGWWSSDAPAGPQDPMSRAGQANLGMAHGISGPLALLALAMRQGITVDGHAAAIESICQWLDSWRQDGPSGPWWPYRITLPELHAGRPIPRVPGRPSWCYGTPGLARAQQLAGFALGDAGRQEAAEDALARCLGDPAQLARITDPSLCHGWAGLVATAQCAANDALSSDIERCLPRPVDALLAHTSDVPPVQQPGLIEGAAGIALTLHEVATGTTGGWRACLLLT